MAVKTGNARDTMHNRRIGLKGEAQARKYLKKCGWKIVEKNFKTAFGEIDIIAKKGDIMAFIEVKTRSSEEFGVPREAVGKSRQTRYIRGATSYFGGREIDCTVRFDVIEVLNGQINHIENAFQA